LQAMLPLVSCHRGRCIAWDSVGTQLFPRFLSVLMVFFSVAILIKTVKNKSAVKDSSSGEGFLASLKLPAAVFGSAAVYLMCIQYVGYFCSTVAYMFLSMFFFGERRPLPIFAAVFIFLAVIYALFISFLGLRLPEGLLF
ncbi:MAG: tripartite tricarboxylate transporter TctB family protein, partial [Synergistes sp.]|nr:tripartite tricarboxylate transporter TctB family protein [Synergistes sp.]